MAILEEDTRYGSGRIRGCRLLLCLASTRSERLIWKRIMEGSDSYLAKIKLQSIVELSSRCSGSLTIKLERIRQCTNMLENRHNGASAIFAFSPSEMLFRLWLLRRRSSASRYWQCHARARCHATHANRRPAGVQAKKIANF
jgi:hypothetical protein